ncbi:hypothetical protein INR49_022513 [Caranx melampygus]|nr:hypothetical protein INR49_022513 [Caranx melampygus]
MRVVNIVGFRRGYNFLSELLGLAKPFGKVVKHLVLDLRPEVERTGSVLWAYLQFTTEEEARAMAKFYNSNVTASVCGRPVRVSHSMTYPTIQVSRSVINNLHRTSRGSRTEAILWVQQGGLRGTDPSSKYSDEAVLKLAEPYGKVRKYFLNRIKRECFIEMDKAEDAEKMADECKRQEVKQEVKQQEQQEHMETSTCTETEVAPPPEIKPSVASLPLPPYDPDSPIGVEHVKMGYYCRVCFLFYSNEDMAKKTHCSSQAHYDKLQKHLEKEQMKAEKKKGKKAPPTTSS